MGDDVSYKSVVATMAPRFPNNSSGSANLGVSLSPRYGSKFTGCKNECNVDLLPVVHPGQRFGKMVVHSSGHSMGQ